MLGGGRLQQGREQTGLDVARQQPGQDLVGLGLELVVGLGLRLGRLLDGLRLQRQEAVHDDAL